MGLGGEYLGVSVPAPLALHAGREPTCGVNSRAAVNHRRLTAHVSVGDLGARWRRRLETAGRAGTQFQSAGPVRAVSDGAYYYSHCRCCRLSPVVLCVGIVREFHGELFALALDTRVIAT